MPKRASARGVDERDRRGVRRSVGHSTSASAAMSGAIHARASTSPSLEIAAP